MREENTDEVTKAILTTVLFVAQKLLEERALLLPQAVTVFLDNYPHSSSPDLHLELEYGRVRFSPRWLLNQLILYLQPFMNFKCIIRRLGTLIYPRHSDPLKCLSFALHDAYSQDSYVNPATYTEGNSSPESMVREAGINDLLHAEIRRLKEKSPHLTLLKV